ncbi:uncharacterized protein CDV56_100432 [Aspergillus thermomutatus]|uniref:Uncharacterized protein n=1 Tax=Aspergillus thermomutatus TaxID=41047 RepID=A0A397FZ23_ASPTH|nr:uncharacterized protein CDV56_100432 [Aspergillus thermomutatus]RHZ43059.1 hypothetical protein CDV56_100432 [Aspergillus thermomutatus]
MVLNECHHGLTLNPLVRTPADPCQYGAPYPAIWGRKSRWEFNTTWHSLITMRSNRRIHRNRFKNIWKSGLTADLGVTNTINAASGGRRLSHATHEIPSCWHQRCISARHATSGTIIMVVPPGAANAGTMNNMLLPLPVGITATIGLSPH